MTKIINMPMIRRLKKFANSLKGEMFTEYVGYIKQGTEEAESSAAKQEKDSYQKVET